MANTVPPLSELYPPANDLVQQLASSQVEAITIGAMAAAADGAPLDPDLSAQTLVSYVDELSRQPPSVQQAIKCRQALALLSNNQNSVLDGFMLEKSTTDSVSLPPGSMDRFLAACTAGAATVTFWGDSRPEGGDQIELTQASYYPARMQALLQKKFPSVTFTFYNYSLSSRWLALAQDAAYVGTATEPANPADGFFRSWSTVGKSWRDTIRDTNADLIILDFGMNGTGAGQDNAQATYLSTIETLILSWTKPADLLVCTTYFPTDLAGQSKQATLATARAYAQWCKLNGIACLDIRLIHRALIDGVKDDEFMATRINDPLADYPTGWTGNGLTNYALVNGALTPSATAFGWVFRPETFSAGWLELDATIPFSSNMWIVFRADTATYGLTPNEGVDLGSLAIIVAPGTGAATITLWSIGVPGFSNVQIATSTGNTIVEGTQYTYKVEFFTDSIKVYLNGVLKLNVTGNYRVLNDGQWGFGSSQTVKPTLVAARIHPGYPLGMGVPVTTQTELLGPTTSSSNPENVQGGNAINHPTSAGHAYLYGAAFQEFISRLPFAVKTLAVVQIATPLSIPAATFTTVTSWNTLTDNGGLHSNSVNPSRITIKKRGRYFISATATFDASVVGGRVIRLMKNGTGLFDSFFPLDPNGLNVSQFTNWYDNCVAGDYYEIQVYQNSGGALNLTYPSRFEVVLVD